MGLNLLLTRWNSLTKNQQGLHVPLGSKPRQLYWHQFPEAPLTLGINGLTYTWNPREMF